MADEIPCKHCGQSETAHKRPEDFDNRDEVLEGYNKSLSKCHRYVSENKKLATRLKNRHEKESRPRGAFVKRTPLQEVERALQQVDWDKYWENVSSKTAKQVDAYREARRKSLEWAQTHYVR